MECLCYFHLFEGILTCEMNSPGRLSNWKSAIRIDNIFYVCSRLSELRSLSSNWK